MLESPKLSNKDFSDKISNISSHFSIQNPFNDDKHNCSDCKKPELGYLKPKAKMEICKDLITLNTFLNPFFIKQKIKTLHKMSKRRIKKTTFD